MKITKNSIIALIVTILILIFSISGCVYKCNRGQITILKQNLRAAQDTVEVFKLSNGNLLYEKAAYILNEKDLLKQLNMTKEELKEIKKKAGQPIYITDIQTVIKYDTINTVKDSIIYKNGDLDYTFKHNDKWLSFRGHTLIKDSIPSTQIFDISIPTSLKVGLTKDYNIFVESTNPYMAITSIEGAALNKSSLVKKPKITHGLTIGLGAQYGILNKQIDIGPQISYGLHINF